MLAARRLRPSDERMIDLCIIVFGLLVIIGGEVNIG